MADTYAQIKTQETEAWAATVAGWAEATKTDPTMVAGGYDQNVAYVRKAVAEFGDDEVRQIFNDYGVGNHPAINRMLAKIGKSMSESGTPKGETRETGETLTHAQVIYGKRG